MNNEEDILLHNDDLEIKVLGSLVSLSQGGNFDDFFKANLSKDLFYTPTNAIIFGIVKILRTKAAGSTVSS